MIFTSGLCGFGSEFFLSAVYVPSVLQGDKPLLQSLTYQKMYRQQEKIYHNNSWHLKYELYNLQKDTSCLFFHRFSNILTPPSLQEDWISVRRQWNQVYIGLCRKCNNALRIHLLFGVCFCEFCGCQNKEWLFPCKTSRDWFMYPRRCVYCVVRTKCLNVNQVNFRLCGILKLPTVCC